MQKSDNRRPAGITALSIFFGFGSFVSAVMALLILFPGSITESTKSASPLLILFSLLLSIAACIACIVASVGLWRCASWGLWTALVILSANILSQLSDLVTVHQVRSLIAILLSGVMIWYLLKNKSVFIPVAASASQ
jgi:hypothetical protein